MAKDAPTARPVAALAAASSGGGSGWLHEDMTKAEADGGPRPVPTSGCFASLPVCLLAGCNCYFYPQAYMAFCSLPAQVRAYTLTLLG